MSIQKPTIGSQESDHSSSSEEEESSDEQSIDQNESSKFSVNNEAIRNFLGGSINPIGNLFQFQTIPNYNAPYFCSFTNINPNFQPFLYNPYLDPQIQYFYYNPYLQYPPIYPQPIPDVPLMYPIYPYIFSNISADYMIQPQQIQNTIYTKSTTRKRHKKSQKKKQTTKSKSKSSQSTTTTSNADVNAKSTTTTSSKSTFEQLNPIEKLATIGNQPIHIKDYCTFAASGTHYIRQPLYICETCRSMGVLGSNEGVCEVCVRTCHQGHEVRFEGICNSFFCDCALKCNCQSNPQSPNLACTRNSASGNPVSQPMYICNSCSMGSSNSYICQNCAIREHHGHDLVYKGIVQNGVCQNDNLNRNPFSVAVISNGNRNQHNFFKKSHPKKSPGQEVQLDLSKEDGKLFKGIIHYLTEECSGNVYNQGAVNITSSSVFDNTYEPYKAADLDNTSSCFESSNNSNSWLCYDFVDASVKPRAYSIRTYANGNGHMKSWAVEGSNDSCKWNILDQQTNSTTFKGSNKTGSFEIKNSNFYRYIRIRQTDKNMDGLHYLNLSAFEIFGTLLE